MQGGLRMCILGIVAGAAAAADLAHLLSGLLYGVEPGDPLIFFVSGTSLLLIAAVACWLPARRATRIDPALALRGE